VLIGHRTHQGEADGDQEDGEVGRAVGTTLMMGNIFTPTHLLLVLAVALIVLGPKRLPEAGRGLGSAIRGFKESLSTEEHSEDQPAIETSSGPDHTSGAPRT
jgi:sec-independent protein translocase protein TatA